MRGAKQSGVAESSELGEAAGKSITNIGWLSCFSVCLVYWLAVQSLFSFLLQRKDSTYLIGVTQGLFQECFEVTWDLHSMLPWR